MLVWLFGLVWGLDVGGKVWDVLVLLFLLFFWVVIFCVFFFVCVCFMYLKKNIFVFYVFFKIYFCVICIFCLFIFVFYVFFSTVVLCFCFFF